MVVVGWDLFAMMLLMDMLGCVVELVGYDFFCCSWFVFYLMSLDWVREMVEWVKMFMIVEVFLIICDFLLRFDGLVVGLVVVVGVIVNGDFLYLGFGFVFLLFFGWKVMNTFMVLLVIVLL